MPRDHAYAVAVHWTGNTGSGTSGYRAYRRDHEVRAPGVPTLLGSSDPAFRGDPSRWNPEQLFLAAVSQCHMLWYLNLAASAGVVVLDYVDHASAVMVEESSGAGQFTSMTLRPEVTITRVEQLSVAETLHHQASSMCFIARSVNFPVTHHPTITVRS
ncbi:MAG: OsmC family protein [Propionibacteriaceae bacterium]